MIQLPCLARTGNLTLSVVLFILAHGVEQIELAWTLCNKQRLRVLTRIESVQIVRLPGELPHTSIGVDEKSIFGLIVVFGIFASSLLASFLIKPIKELSAGVEELKYGTAKNPLRIYSQDELGKLTRNFNEMAALISDQRGKLTG